MLEIVSWSEGLPTIRLKAVILTNQYLLQEISAAPVLMPRSARRRSPPRRSPPARRAVTVALEHLSGAVVKVAQAGAWW